MRPPPPEGSRQRELLQQSKQQMADARCRWQREGCSARSRLRNMQPDPAALASQGRSHSLRSATCQAGAAGEVQFRQGQCSPPWCHADSLHASCVDTQPRAPASGGHEQPPAGSSTSGDRQWEGHEELGAPAGAAMTDAHRLEFDALDWDVFELLQQTAADTWEMPHQHPPTSSPGHRSLLSLQPGRRQRQLAASMAGGQQRQRQPTSPLARHLAALRGRSTLGAESSMSRPGEAATAAGLRCEADDHRQQPQSLHTMHSSCETLRSSSPSGPAACAALLFQQQQPRQGQQEQWQQEAALPHAISLLVPQELLADGPPLTQHAGSSRGGISSSIGSEPLPTEAGQQAPSVATAQHDEAADQAAARLRQHCWHGRYEEARLALRDAGAGVLECADAEGRTPLLLACAGGHGRIIKLLLRKGASLAARDADGCTALHLAVLRGHAAVARHLITQGADASCRNHAGMSAADLIAGWAEQQRQEVERGQPQGRQEG